MRWRVRYECHGCRVQAVYADSVVAAEAYNTAVSHFGRHGLVMLERSSDGLWELILGHRGPDYSDIACEDY